MRLIEGINRAVAHLDAIGFNYGDMRISVYRALVTVIVVFGMLALARAASGGVRRLFRKMSRLDPAERVLGEKIVGIAVWVVCILVGIDLLGIDLTALTVFSGAFGLAVGFGLQKTFGNLLAGIILLMDRSIKPGDMIAVSDGVTNTVGQVSKIGLRAVSVVTRDRKEYLIPNENLMVNQVENWSYSSRDVRVKVPVDVSYDTDIELAERLMLEAAKASPRVLDFPHPTVQLMALGASAIEFEMRIWIDDPEEGMGNIRSDVLKRLWYLFRENGVRIPFQQRDVHIRDWPGNPLRPSTGPGDGE